MADDPSHEVFHPDGPLGRSLSAQVEALRHLHELLDDEYRLLSERDPLPLSELSERKAEAAERLARLTAEGERQLATLGLPSGRVGWQLWIQGIPEGIRHSAETLWAALVEELEAVARQNEVNGRTLALRQQATETLLDALRGQRRDTYGPRLGKGGQALAKA